MNYPKPEYNYHPYALTGMSTKTNTKNAIKTNERKYKALSITSTENRIKQQNKTKENRIKQQNMNQMNIIRIDHRQ